MTIEALEKRLKAHDHYYEFSDDHHIFLRGQLDRAELLVELKKMPLCDVYRLLKTCVPDDRLAVWLTDLWK